MFADIRLMAFLAAMAVYALAGTPTPDRFGPAEIFVALCLVVAAGGWQVAYLFRQVPSMPWRRAGQTLLFYGLSIPVIAGIFSGSAPGLMLRDVIPFLFFLLPLFLPVFSNRRLVTAAVAAAGLVFSLRVILPVLFIRGGFHMASPPDPFYMANAPTVLFAALLMAGSAGQALYQGATLRRVAQASVLLALAFFPLAAMVLINQRASIGVIALGMAFLLALAFIRNPARALLPALAVAAGVWAGAGIAQTIIQGAAEKTAQVGLNMRWQEAQAVFALLDDSAWAMLFGRGWGATVVSPAVGDMPVNYTHSLITTYMLKTGLCGLGLALGWLYRLGQGLVRLFPVRPVLAVALAGPLMIDIFFYASFKSLDFGLILLLISLWDAQLHNPATGDKVPEEIPVPLKG